MSCAEGAEYFSIPACRVGRLAPKAMRLRDFGRKSQAASAGNISRLAALKGRPCVGSVQILGDADPIDYGLPPEYREAIQKFFGYARSRGIYTHSIRTAVSAIPKHDHYHFREDSTSPCYPRELHRS